MNIHILKLQTPCVKRGLKKSFLNASSSGFPRHGSVTSAIRKSIKSKTRRSLIDHLNAFNNCAFFFSEPTTETTTGNTPSPGKKKLFLITKGTQRQFSENICSEDDLRSRIFGTFVVKFLAFLPLLGFSNI